MFKSILAGVVIGLGGYAYLMIDNKILGSLLFSIGLLSVLKFNFNLYTGKVCQAHYLNKPLPLVLVLIGNFIGTIIMSLLTLSKIQDIAYQLMTAKLNKPLLQIICDGIICELCIALAVKSKDVYIVIMAVMVFILTGAEHCVADMYYLFASGDVTLRKLLFILAVVFANTIGGVFCMSIKGVSVNENK